LDGHIVSKERLLMQADVEIVERCLTDRGELQLQRRGNDYEIISNGVFLMATYNGQSERQLVAMALSRSNNPDRVLIGGLGVGFSLQEALGEPRAGEVVVLEVEPKIIEWNSRYFSGLMGDCLQDARIHIIQDDLLTWLGHTGETFDVVCIDIDNGPDWTVVESNDRLYTETGLQSLVRILRPRGIIAFWSAARSIEFFNRLERFFDHVEEHRVECSRGEPDRIYVAQRR
jgi:spermidine synthase